MHVHDYIQSFYSWIKNYNWNSSPVIHTHSFKWFLISQADLPDKLKLDWWRFLIGGGWFLAGEDLVEGAGVAYFGVAGISYTGPSYIPLETPCSPPT